MVLRRLRCGTPATVLAERATPPPGRGFLRRPGLLLPAVLAPMAEVALVRTLGPAGSAALGPQVTAPPPLDLFHDLRWISVFHDTWVVLAFELVAVVVLRSLWVAWMVPAPPTMSPAMAAMYGCQFTAELAAVAGTAAVQTSPIHVRTFASLQFELLSYVPCLRICIM